MKNFLSGRINKIVALLLLFYLPLIVIAFLPINDNLGLSKVIGIFLCSLLLRYLYGKRTLTSFIPNLKLKLDKLILSLLLGFAISCVNVFGFIKLGVTFSATNNNNIALLISTVIVAPITEEIFFRAFFSKVWLNENRTKIFSLTIIGSLIWSFSHATGFILQNLVIVLMGIVLYIIYFKTQNVIYCIFTHLAINLTSQFILCSYIENINKIINNNYVFVICIVLLAVCFYFAIKRLCNNELFHAISANMSYDTQYDKGFDINKF